MLKILIPKLGIEPKPPIVEVQNLNHWTTVLLVIQVVPLCLGVACLSVYRMKCQNVCNYYKMTQEKKSLHNSVQWASLVAQLIKNPA